MSVPTTIRFVMFAVLVVLMAATRFTHAGSAGVLPDASWAVFFAAGFYFSREGWWALAALLAAAVGIDYLSIRHYGISNYCVTLAYWLIVPAYAILWIGGAWLRRHYRRTPIDLLRLLASFAASATLCFLVNHSAFYWLGDRIEHPTLSEWWMVLTEWYPYFLTATGAYVAVAAVAHVVLTQPRAATRLSRWAR